MKIYTRAGGARGVYIHRSNGRQIFRATIAVHNGTRIRPELNIATRGRRGVRIVLPHVPWTYPMGRARRAAFRASERFWGAVR